MNRTGPGMALWLTLFGPTPGGLHLNWQLWEMGAASPVLSEPVTANDQDTLVQHVLDPLGAGDGPDGGP